jgi:hypothetical protein
MVQTKRKYKKKNKKTRRQRGGLESNKNGIALFNDHFDRHVPTEEQKCIKSMKKNSKYNMKLPIWIDRLKRQLPRDQQRRWQKAIEDTRWAERMSWCKKKGYCKTGKAFIKATTNKTKKRCIDKPNTGGWCEVDLNLLEWNHCVNKCGRHKSIDSPKLKAAKDKEAKITCNEVRVKIGNNSFSMQDAAKGLEEHNAKIKKDMVAKKAKELAEKKEREKKARLEAELAIARAKKAMEEKKRKQAEEKRKLKEAEETRKEKLRKEKEDKKRKEEEHRRKVAQAKEKKEKDKLEKLRKEKEAREEVERKRKEKEAKEEADRMQKLKDKKEKDAKAKTKCITNMLNDFNDESGKIIESVLNGHENVNDWIKDSNHVEEALKKMSKINDAQRKVSKKYNDCFKKINANLPAGPRNELNAKLKDIQKKLMTYFEQINDIEERIEKEEAEEYKVQSPQNLKFSGQVTDSYDFKLAPKKCKEKRACDNQLKNKIQNKKGLRNKPQFCIGSVIEGQDLYGSSMSMDYYTGVVIGNAIEKGLPAKYQPGYPAIYYSNYNYGSFPFYSILVKVNKPTKSKIDNFKKWYYKMAKRHGDKPGKYPINTLKSMTVGKLTKKVKSKKGKSYSQNSSSKPQPQKIPVQFIKYLPCIPKGQSGGGTRKSKHNIIMGKRKTRKRSKRGGQFWGNKKPDPKKETGTPKYVGRWPVSIYAGNEICAWYEQIPNCGGENKAKVTCINSTTIQKKNKERCSQGFKPDQADLFNPIKNAGTDIVQEDSFKTKNLPANLENLETVNQVIEGKRNAYLIVYEKNSGSTGGPRWSLRAFHNCDITKVRDVTTMKSPHHKDPIKIKKDGNRLVLTWGSKEKKGLKIGTILFGNPIQTNRRATAPPRLGSGGGRRKKRTRRRSKKKRRKRRKRTKKKR